VTTSSSHGCWQYVQFEGESIGEVTFDGDALPWQLGVYEARYHLSDRYIVASFSEIFEIRGIVILTENLFITSQRIPCRRLMAP
jgi:hypothetical protein